MVNKGQENQDAVESLNRRRLLATLSAAGVAGVAGCGGSDTTPTETGGNNGGGGDSSETNNNNGNSGNVNASNSLTTRIGNDPQTLDPHVVPAQEDVAWMIMPPNAYETLVFFEGSTDTLKPLLATKVPTVDNGLITNDGKTYEFPLREGVTFHDGEEMTAEDVKFSLNRGPTIGLSGDAGQLAVIDNIEIMGDYRIKIHLSEVNGPFLAAALTRPVAGIVSKQAVMDNGGVSEGQPNEYVAQNTIGTGPYVLDSWERGSYLRFNQHSEYWGDVETITGVVQQEVVPEYSTTAAMMQNNQLHHVPASAAALDSFQGIEDINFKYTPSLDVAALHFNYNIPYGEGVLPQTAEDDTVPSDFFQDKDIRKGFAYAIDYEGFIESIFGGHASRMNYMHQPSARFYDDEAPIYTHDPEKAEEHFRNAGVWEDGFRVTCTTEAIPEFKQGQLFIKDNLSSLNSSFNLNVQAFPESRYTEFRSQRPWAVPCELLGFLPMGPDPAPYYAGFFLEDGPIGAGATGPDLDVSDVIDPRIVELTKQGASTADPGERREIYNELQQLCYEEVPHAVISVEDLVDVEQPCVSSVHNGLYEGSPLKSWDISSCGDLNTF